MNTSSSRVGPSARSTRCRSRANAHVRSGSKVVWPMMLSPWRSLRSSVRASWTASPSPRLALRRRRASFCPSGSRAAGSASVIGSSMRMGGDPPPVGDATSMPRLGVPRGVPLRVRGTVGRSCRVWSSSWRLGARRLRACARDKAAVLVAALAGFVVTLATRDAFADEVEACPAGWGASTYARVMPSVVRITSGNSEGGAGFLFADACHVPTALHVVDSGPLRASRGSRSVRAGATRLVLAEAFGPRFLLFPFSPRSSRTCRSPRAER